MMHVIQSINPYTPTPPTSGMGLELLMHVIQSINPDAVFQLRKSEDKPSKEVLDSHYANNFTFRHPPLNKVGTDMPCVLFIVFTVILLHIYPSLAPFHPFSTILYTKC